MAADVLILARDPGFGPGLTRLIQRVLDLTVETTDSEYAVEEALADRNVVIVMESAGSPADFALLLRAWRIRPEAPVVVCAPPAKLDAHRAFGPLALLPSPTPPAPLLRAVQRALCTLRWVDESARAPIGMPAVLPIHMASVDVMNMLRRDPLTYNLWRETSNPGFHRPGWAFGPERMPAGAHSLARAFLPRADLSRANLTRMSLFGASLRESSGIFVQLEGADLRDTDLASVLFVGSDLSGADLRGANLERAEFIACDLRGAYMDPMTLQHVLLVDCELDRQPQKASPPQTV